jgi:hypothetical protein
MDSLDFDSDDFRVKLLILIMLHKLSIFVKL